MSWQVEARNHGCGRPGLVTLNEPRIEKGKIDEHGAVTFAIFDSVVANQILGLLWKLERTGEGLGGHDRRLRTVR